MLGRHPRAALQFSGGKDSLALLHLARPYLDRIEVFFGDTGAVYPHVVEFVEKTCRELGAELKVVRPFQPVLDYHEAMGLPVDVLPIDSTHHMQKMKRTELPKLQAWLHCCQHMIWQPVDQAIRERGHTLILRGSKACDPHRTVPDMIDRGVEYSSPLWEWSDADVMQFLSGKEMPAQYPEIMESMDCWCCTAQLTSPYAKQKLEFARAYYPDLYPHILARLRAMKSAMDGEKEKIDLVLAEVIPEEFTHG